MITRAVVSSSRRVNRGRSMMWRFATEIACSRSSVMHRGRRIPRCKPYAPRCRGPRCPKGLRACDPVGPQARVPSVPRRRVSRSEALCEGIAPGDGSIRAWNLPTSRATELLPEHIRVCLRGSRRDAEPLCDLVVRASGGDQLDHLKLPIGDDGRSLMQDCDHGDEANSAIERRLLTLRRVFPYTPEGVGLAG